MAAGDLVATLSVAGQPSINFALTSNPGGFFVISGNSILEAINTPDGNYPIALQANGPGGFSVTQPFVLTFTATGPGLVLQEDGTSFVLQEDGTSEIII